MTKYNQISSAIAAPAAIGALILATLFLPSTVLAAKGVCKDGTPPPCKPGTSEETAQNNLSFPAIISDNVYPAGWLVVTGWMFAPIAAGADTLPFGCVGEDDIVPPATVDPSILCYWGRKNLGLDEVTGLPNLVGDPTLWWLQQRAANKWQAHNPVDPDPSTPVVVTAVDWGDLLESAGTLKQKQVRTEMTLLQNVDSDPDFNTVDGASTLFGLCPDETVNCFAAFAMSGAVPGTDQSIAEIQGTDYGPGALVGDFPGTRALIDPREVKPGFDATVYSRCARLAIQKITGDAASLSWDPATGHWEGPAVNNPAIDLSAQTDAYSAEINAGGNLIYGFNWNTKQQAEGSGVYRLTFVIDGPSRCPVSNTEFGMDTIIANPGNLNEAFLVPKGDMRLNGGDEGGLTYIDITVQVSGGGGKKK
jgi:hypothetical protein